MREAPSALPERLAAPQNPRVDDDVRQDEAVLTDNELAQLPKLVAFLADDICAYAEIFEVHTRMLSNRRAKCLCAEQAGGRLFSPRRTKQP